MFLRSLINGNMTYLAIKCVCASLQLTREVVPVKLLMLCKTRVQWLTIKRWLTFLFTVSHVITAFCGLSIWFHVGGLTLASITTLNILDYFSINLFHLANYSDSRTLLVRCFQAIIETVFLALKYFLWFLSFLDGSFMLCHLCSSRSCDVAANVALSWSHTNVWMSN